MTRGVRLTDAALPLLLAVLSAVELVALDTDGTLPAVVLSTVSCAFLVLRRRWPWAAPTAAGALNLLMPYLGPELDEPAVPILVLGVAGWTMGRWLVDLRGSASVALFVLMALVGASNDHDRALNVTDVVFLVVIMAPPYFAGRVGRSMAARTERLRAQHEELLRLQGLVRQEAAAAERGRIARELHDVIAHSISAMVVQASAASSLIERDPKRAAQAIDDVASTGREALAETGRLLHLLRDNAGELGLAPDKGLERLPDLVEEAGRSGLDIDLKVEGSLEHLPAGVGLSAYRIVQEAMTNARKHAADKAVSVLLERRPDELRITATNRAGAKGDGSGLGLVGMAERVSVFGGRLTHGVQGERFVLEAALPLPAEP